MDENKYSLGGEVKKKNCRNMKKKMSCAYGT
jgi:hypothetical protein